MCGKRLERCLLVLYMLATVVVLTPDLVTRDGQRPGWVPASAPRPDSLEPPFSPVGWGWLGEPGRVV